IVIGAVAYVLWTIAYFVGFWSTTGETPGDRVMLIRVVSSSGERVKPRWALVRCAGAVLSALPLFAGYLMILFTRRRRGLLDVLARTVVIESPTRSRAAIWRERLKQGRSSDSGDEPAASISQA
ncbi:MAG TPA: RDD family protein, partial [Solirubrobacteraceae bacterium]|nr:RDD family protein [Solirubrobacteraceae bacterium]